MKLTKSCIFATVIGMWAWLIASYIDVVTNNLGDCVYQSWNLFSMFF